MQERITVYPADVVLFEGILVFYPQIVREMFHMKLFVDTDSDVRLSRRGMYDMLHAPNSRYCHGLMIISGCSCSSARHEPRERSGADSHTVHNICQTCLWRVLPACKCDFPLLIFFFVLHLRHVLNFPCQTKKYADVIIPRGVDNMGECFCKHSWPQRTSSGMNGFFTGDLCLISGHQPHRAAHPGHTKWRHLQMAAGLPQRADFEAGHHRAKWPA